MLATRKFSRIRKLWKCFRLEYYVDQRQAPSYSTILRFIHRQLYSQKVPERRHILQDPAKRVGYIRTIRMIPPVDIVDIDEAASSDDQFLERKGWAVVGQKYLKTQFKIG